MNIASQRRVTTRYAKEVEGIMDILEGANVSAAHGEILLLHIAGISAGNRQQSIRNEWLEPLAIAWAFAAEMGEG